MSVWTMRPVALHVLSSLAALILLFSVLIIPIYTNTLCHSAALTLSSSYTVYTQHLLELLCFYGPGSFWLWDYFLLDTISDTWLFTLSFYAYQFTMFSKILYRLGLQISFHAMQTCLLWSLKNYTDSFAIIAYILQKLWHYIHYDT